MSRVIGILIGLAFTVALQAAPPAAPHPDASRTILIYGDSLSAGYGLAGKTGWADLLSDRLLQQGYGFRVVNASVSGETTTGGLSRLPRALGLHHPTLILLELGANDGLRGLPLATSRSNLASMITLAETNHAQVLLLGMRMPPNYGARYTGGFAAIFADLARHHHAQWVPFFLNRVADRPDLMQADGLHPNERGQPVLLDNVWSVLKPMLQAGRHG